MATIHGQQAGIKVDATKALQKLRAVNALLTPQDILDTIGQRILRDTGLLLDAAGRTAGNKPWQQMKPLTIKRRPVRQSNRHFSSPYQTLLRQSMVAQTNAGAGEVEVGTNARYAKFHHAGGRHLPARPLLPQPAAARAGALLVVQAIVKQFAAVGNN